MQPRCASAPAPEVAGTPPGTPSSCIDPQTPNSTLVGTYHLPCVVDEVNLTLRANGTFRWKIFGCDFFGEESGQWIVEGQGLRLSPRAGHSDFFWVEDSVERVKTVFVSRTDDGELLAVASHLEQKWTPGRICAQCGGDPGQLGPTGLVRCEDQSGL